MGWKGSMNFKNGELYVKFESKNLKKYTNWEIYT